MVDCKYILPCGRCDKLGTPCEAFINEIKELQEDFDRYKSEYCEHDWHSVGILSGTKSRYQVYICSKCNKQRTKKTVIYEDGKYDTYIYDD